VVGLFGRSGTGKSTLLQLLSGLVPWLRAAEVGGCCSLDGESLEELDPGQRAHLLATCLDRPDAQLFLPTPGHELAAAQQLYGASELVTTAIDTLSLGHLLARRTTELSSGERQRVALAVVLAACPRPVLMDEPTAHLDQQVLAQLPELLAEVRRRNGSVILTEQAGWQLAAGVDRWHELVGASLVSRSCPQPPQLPRPEHSPGEQVVLRGRDLVVSRGDRQLLDRVNLQLRAGEVVLLSGANGAGKSTLARVLARLQAPASGSVEPDRSRAALMLPVAELQLFAATVAEELCTKGTKSSEPGELARVLRRHRLEAMAARAPWTLSRGERQRLVHAALDLLRPEVMIIDEPGQGLDPEDLLQLVRLIHRRAVRGRAYLLISHRRELAMAAHRHLQVQDRQLEEV
jgi:energy-coupling factor transport system ATP-binding protein